MLIFLDTANFDEIEHFADFIDGVTTNPSLLAKSDIEEIPVFVKEVCKVVSGPVSVEVFSEKTNEMLEEARFLASIDENVCVKIPCNQNGFRVCKALSEDGIAVNMTLCFSAAQAVIAAQCGATYVSPFVGRLDDSGEDGLDLIATISDVYQSGGYETCLLASSIRNVHQFVEVASMGVDAVTVSPKILAACMEHPMTDAGLRKFADDWNRDRK